MLLMPFLTWACWRKFIKTGDAILYKKEQDHLLRFFYSVQIKKLKNACNLLTRTLKWAGMTELSPVIIFTSAPNPCKKRLSHIAFVSFGTQKQSSASFLWLLIRRQTLSGTGGGFGILWLQFVAGFFELSGESKLSIKLTSSICISREPSEHSMEEDKSPTLSIAAEAI